MKLKFDSLKSDPDNHLGSGQEKVVVRDAKDPMKVEGTYLNTLTNQEIKATFYLNKILHELFPNEFKNVYQAGNTGGAENKSVISAEYIEIDPGHALRTQNFDEAEDDFLERRSSSTEYLLKCSEEMQDLLYGSNAPRIITSLREAGVQVDATYGNVSDMSPDAKYIDVIRPFVIQRGKIVWKCDLLTLQEYIYDHVHDDVLQKRLSAYIERILTLVDQQKEALQKP